MKKLNLVNTIEMFSAIEKLFDIGQNVRISVTGTSMYPFLRNGIDSVELSRTTFNEIVKGDIVLARNKDGKYILHRVWKKSEDSFIMWGDGLPRPDQVFDANSVIAIARNVWRKDRKICCESISWRVLIFFWTHLRLLFSITAEVCSKICTKIFYRHKK